VRKLERTSCGRSSHVASNDKLRGFSPLRHWSMAGSRVSTTPGYWTLTEGEIVRGPTNGEASRHCRRAQQRCRLCSPILHVCFARAVWLSTSTSKQEQCDAGQYARARVQSERAARATTLLWELCSAILDLCLAWQSLAAEQANAGACWLHKVVRRELSSRRPKGGLRRWNSHSTSHIVVTE
jgi:hypothetical protein